MVMDLARELENSLKTIHWLQSDGDHKDGKAHFPKWLRHRGVINKLMIFHILDSSGAAERPS